VTIINPRRAYFCYGVGDHDIDVNVKIVAGGNTAGSNGCIIVGREGQFDCGSMNVRVTMSGDVSRYVRLSYIANRMADDVTGGNVGPIFLAIDLDASVPNPGGATVRFALISYDKDMVEKSELPNNFLGITLGGNFLDVGAGNSGSPIEVAHPPAGQTLITLRGEVRVQDWRTCVMNERIAIKVDARREIRMKSGVGVDGCSFTIPVSAIGGFSMRHSLYAHDGNAGFGNSTYREDVIIGVVSGPNGDVLVPQQIAAVAPAGAGATRIGVIFGGGDRQATVTLASATYATDTAYALLETTYSGEQGG